MEMTVVSDQMSEVTLTGVPILEDPVFSGGREDSVQSVGH